MAASTLQAMLIRLGFDLTGLVAGGAEAKAQLAGIKAAADAANAAYARANSQGRPLNAANQFMSTQPWKEAAAAASSGATQIVAAQDKIAAAADRMNVSLGGLKIIAGTIALLGFVQFTHGAVEAATTFQTQMTLLQTQARATADEVNHMTDSILGMSVGLQTGPEELAKGLYHIESVGKRGAEALDILRVSAEGARVGNADLESVTNAMVAAVTSGISGVTNMSEAMGTLNGIVGSGNMRMQDLADSLRSGVLATANAFGVSLQQVGAALATMTDQGIPATEAATRLRITMALLAAPTRTAAEQLSRIGLSSTQLAEDMRSEGGLIGAVKDLSAHLKQSGFDAVQQAQILKAAFGGSRSSSGLLTLINTTELADQKLKIIGDTASHFAETFAIQSQTAAAKFADLGAAVQTLSVHFGNALLPIATAAAGAMSFLAQQTALMVPILLLVTGAVIRLATIALVRLIASLGLTASYFALGRIASILLNLGLQGLATTGVVTAVSIRGIGMAVLVALGPLNLLMIALTAVAVVFGKVQEAIDKETAAFVAHVKAVAAAAQGSPRQEMSALDQLTQERDYLKSQLKDQIRSRSLLQSIDFGPIKPGTILSAEPGLRAGIKIYDDLIKGIQAQQKKVAGAIKTGSGLIIDATQTLVEQLGTTLSGVLDAAGGNLGAALMSQYAKQLSDNQKLPMDAFNALKDAEKNSLNEMDAEAQLKGILASKALSDGLRSGIPAVRAAALAAKMAAEEDLFSRGINANTPAFQLEISRMRAAQGQAAASSRTLAGTVRDMNAAIRDTGASAADAAKSLLSKFGTSIKSIDAMGKNAGADLAQAIADGIAANQQKPIDALKKLHAALQTQQSKHAQIAFLLAALAGQDLARGLASSDPTAHAQAVATIKIYTDQMDILTNGAYSAGMNAANNFIRGWALPLARGHANAQAIATLQGKLTNAWSNGGKGGLSPAELAAGTAAYDKLIKSLKDVGAAAGSSANALQSSANKMVTAWTKIHDSAMKYFDKLHAANLKAIDDHKAMIQATIDHAQAGLDAVDKAEQLQSLLAAVQNATDPQSQLAALQALHKFQAQQQIDAAQKAADLQQKIATDAENERYSKQIAAFNKALNALETYLDKHPKLWKSSQERVIKLLHSFGVSYSSAGELLGNSFAKGFKSALQNLEKAMAGALKIKVSWATLVLGGKGFAEGAWKLAQDQYAQVHAGEMIVPATAAGPLRDWLSRAGGGGQAGSPWSLGISGSGAMRQRAGDRGGGTLIFKVGDEELARLTDRRLYIEKTTRQPQEIEFGGSTR